MCNIFQDKIWLSTDYTVVLYSVTSIDQFNFKKNEIVKFGHFTFYNSATKLCNFNKFSNALLCNYVVVIFYYFIF